MLTELSCLSSFLVQWCWGTCSKSVREWKQSSDWISRSNCSIYPVSSKALLRVSIVFVLLPKHDLHSFNPCRQRSRTTSYRRSPNCWYGDDDAGCNQRWKTKVRTCCFSSRPVARHRPSIGSSREILEEELESVGIRLNTRKPDIYFKVRTENVHDQSMNVSSI